MKHPHLDAETLEVSVKGAGGGASARVVTLTIAHHAEPERVGERARLVLLSSPRGRVAISRGEPAFAQPGAPVATPLLSPFVSRKPLFLVGLGGGAVRVDASEAGGHVEVDGEPLTGTVDLSADALERGVVLQVGSHIVLILHLDAAPDSAASTGHRGLPDAALVGESDAMVTLRAAIARVAGDTRPVLVRGETGTGKELVAQALHAASPRRSKPLVAVNMAAVPATLAASELFGHARGAFSGADAAHDGHFVRAAGGTLFLDEIADTPLEVQAALLRVLETGEVLPVGGRAVKAAEVRVVAATDADLERLIAEGRFRAPLYYRLAANELRLPPLRARRADIGRLVTHFLLSELETLGRSALLRPAAAERSPWLSAALVARLCRYDWPGNVRQLRSVCHALALSSATPGGLPASELDRLLPDPPASLAPTATPANPMPANVTPASAPAPRPRSPAELTPEEVERVLESFDYRLSAAADHFGISRPSMNELVDRHPRLKRAQRLTAEEIRGALDTEKQTGEAAWRALRVSERGLKQRCSELGLDRL